MALSGSTGAPGASVCTTSTGINCSVRTAFAAASTSAGIASAHLLSSLPKRLTRSADRASTSIQNCVDADARCSSRVARNSKRTMSDLSPGSALLARSAAEWMSRTSSLTWEWAGPQRRRHVQRSSPRSSRFKKLRFHCFVKVCQAIGTVQDWHVRGKACGMYIPRHKNSNCRCSHLRDCPPDGLSYTATGNNPDSRRCETMCPRDRLVRR